MKPEELEATLLKSVAEYGAFVKRLDGHQAEVDPEEYTLTAILLPATPFFDPASQAEVDEFAARLPNVD